MVCFSWKTSPFHQEGANRFHSRRFPFVNSFPKNLLHCVWNRSSQHKVKCKSFSVKRNKSWTRRDDGLVPSHCVYGFFFFPHPCAFWAVTFHPFQRSKPCARTRKRQTVRPSLKSAGLETGCSKLSVYTCVCVSIVACVVCKGHLLLAATGSNSR